MCTTLAGQRRAAALVLAMLAACTVPGPSDMPPKTDPAAVPSDMSPQTAPAPACDARDTLGDTSWLPADLRLAVILDLDSPDLPAAIVRLQDGVREGRGLPVVASRGLGLLGLLLDILRPQLRRAGLDPRELALLHDREGAVVWVLRARCDLEALQARLAASWSLQVRTLTGGSVAEGRRDGADATGFAFDVAFLAEDRLALTPPGSAPALRRWLSGPPAAPLAGPAAPPPAEVLDEIPAAPIRGVLAGRSLQAPGASTVPLVRTLRATADALEIDGQR
ncbi:MAG TPA: hypothetical protein VGB85_18730 [Nannocystis sp.]